MQRRIWDALCGDRRARTAQVGNLIEAKLVGGTSKKPSAISRDGTGQHQKQPPVHAPKQW